MEITMGNNANMSLYKSKVKELLRSGSRQVLGKINSTKCKMKAGWNQNKHVFYAGNKHLIPRRTFAYCFKLKDSICTAGS